MRIPKSFLLRGTALSTVLILALGASQDGAAEILRIKVRGYSTQYFGYARQDNLGSGEFSGLDVKSDTEIYFTGDTILDNGISIGINIQLEGNSSSDQIDESYLTVSGKFGQVIVGSENSAMYKLHTAPDGLGFGLNSGDNVEWAVFEGIGGTAGAFRGPFAATMVEPGRVNDANRMTYLTPRVAGFQFGASYVPDSAEDNNSQADRNRSLHDGATFAIQYSRAFDDASFEASAGYGFMQSGDSSGLADPTSYNFGLSVGVGAWTLGGAYAYAADDTHVGDMTGYTAGLKYFSKPWSFGVAAFLGERDGSTSANLGGCGPLKATYDTIQIETSYELGAGATMLGVLGHSSLDDESGIGDDSDSIYVVGGLRLTF